MIQQPAAGQQYGPAWAWGGAGDALPLQHRYSTGAQLTKTRAEGSPRLCESQRELRASKTIVVVFRGANSLLFEVHSPGLGWAGVGRVSEATGLTPNRFAIASWGRMAGCYAPQQPKPTGCVNGAQQRFPGQEGRWEGGRAGKSRVWRGAGRARLPRCQTSGGH